MNECHLNNPFLSAEENTAVITGVRSQQSILQERAAAETTLVGNEGNVIPLPVCPLLTVNTSADDDSVRLMVERDVLAIDNG